MHLVFDGHNDTLTSGRSFLEPSTKGHLNLARARSGGFAGGFFALFTAHPTRTFDDAARGPDIEPEPPVERAHALATTLATAGRLLLSKWPHRRTCVSCAARPTSSWAGRSRR